VLRRKWGSQPTAGRAAGTADADLRDMFHAAMFDVIGF